MALETLADIITQISDWVGVYGAHTDGEKIECRICFEISLRQRIEAACNIEAIMRRVNVGSAPSVARSQSDRGAE
jgi:hypothetical protein